MGLHWYAIRSKPNKEVVLWRELLARGFECFYPHLQVKPVNPRSRTCRPYFPGYLFLNTDLEQVPLSTFQWMPFSVGLVSFDGVPGTVPLDLLQAIRRHVEQINAAGKRLSSGLKHGDLVVIHSGPFDGYEAIFDTQLPGSERVRVLLKILNVRELRVELPAGQLQKKR